MRFNQDQLFLRDLLARIAVLYHHDVALWIVGHNLVLADAAFSIAGNC